jgi:hypothetical protein
VRSLKEHIFVAFLTPGHLRYRKWLIIQRNWHWCQILSPKEVKMQVERWRKLALQTLSACVVTEGSYFNTQSVWLTSKIRGLNPRDNNNWVEYYYSLFCFFFLESKIQSEGKIQAGRPENRGSIAGQRGTEIFIFFPPQVQTVPILQPRSSAPIMFSFHQVLRLKFLYSFPMSPSASMGYESRQSRGSNGIAKKIL